MSTNYYLKIHPQIFNKTLGIAYSGNTENGFAPLHIGLSAGGWCFQMRMYPEYNINTIHDWEKLIYNDSDSLEIIVNEYGASLTRDAMISIIKERESYVVNNAFDERFLDMNGAIIGPHNLLRSKIDGVYCIGHGEGSWDYIVGDFC